MENTPITFQIPEIILHFNDWYIGRRSTGLNLYDKDSDKKVI